MLLKESADYTIKTRQEWLEEAKKAKELLELLPEEVLQLGGDADYNTSAKTLIVNVFGPESKKALKMAGVQNLKPKLVGKDSWMMGDGVLQLTDEITAEFKAYNIEAPPNCRIEEYTEVVTRYRAICPETEEEVT